MSATVTKHVCALCGAKRPAEALVFSTFTRNRYCGPQHWKACEQRRRRARRAAAR